MIFKIKTKYFNDKGQQVGNAVVARKEIPIEDICSIEEVYNEKVKFMKTKCMLICRPPIGNIIIEKSFEDMNKILENEKTKDVIFIKGFIRYDEAE